MKDVDIARELTAAIREIEEVDPKFAAGFLDDVRAIKMSAAVTALFGRIINLRNDIEEAVTKLQHEAEDSGEVSAILREIPVLRDVLKLGKELRVMATKIPRRDVVQSRITRVLTIG